MGVKIDEIFATGQEKTSPVEHSWEYYRRNGPLTKGAERDLPVILVPRARNTDSNSQLTRTAISPMKHSQAVSADFSVG